MKLRKTLAAAGALAIAGGMLAVQPAQAENATTPQVDETTLTYTLNAGALFIDSPDATQTAAAAVGSATIAMTVAATSVSNNTGTLDGWQVNATVTDFVYSGDYTNDPIPCDNLTWLTQNAASLDGLTVASALTVPGAFLFVDGVEDDGVCAGGPVLTGLNGVSGGDFSYTGLATLAIPVNSKAGAYTGTLTQTISAVAAGI